MSSLSVKLSFPTRVQPEVLPKEGMAGVYTNQLHYFKKHLLDELVKKKFASDFMTPVDTEELQIPHYYSVIHRPMDVGTITKRVENNYYRDVEEAISDFRLLIRNCFMFNGVDTLVYRKGVQLEKFFQRALKNMPKGPPVPCNKDPMSTCKLKASPMAGAMEQECRNQLRRLQTVTNQADAIARNYFAPKWNSFSTKLDKQNFKSIEDFRSAVDALFKKYHDQARMVYEKVYDQPGGFDRNGSTSTSASTSDQATPASSICLSVSDVNDMLRAVQLTQNNLNQCLKQPQTSKSLAETFSATIAQFKLKLEGIKSKIPAQNSANSGENQSIVEEKPVPANLYLPTESLDILMDTPDAGLSDDDSKLDPIDAMERQSIQTLFGTLPTRSMREICAIVYSNENIGTDLGGGLTFDLKHFELANVYIMKAAVDRALKIMNNSKVKLKDMPPQEKEDLRCSLQNQLSTIEERLANGQGRKNNGSQKRGRKRAKTEDPQLENETSEAVETKKRALSLPRPQSPVPVPVTKASHKSTKSKKAVQKVPNTPKRNIPIIRTPIRIPKTPEGWSRGRISVSKLTPKSAKRRAHVRVRGRVQPKNPPAVNPKKVKKVKTHVDNSSDEEEHVDKNYETPCSSTKPKAKKSKKAKKHKKAKKEKSSLFLTPGNPLNSDLSLSSSDDED